MLKAITHALPENPWHRLILFWIVLLFALRFFFIGDTIFIADEPLFQLKIDEAFATHQLPLSSFRGSSIPLPYGAGGIWFYLLPRLFFWHPYATVLWHISIVTSSVVLFVSTLRRRFGGEAAIWGSLLVASSPLLFFFTRHPWDNTILIALSALTVWCLVKLEEGAHELAFHAALGAIAGYALNIHLMFGPVALALGLTLLWRAWLRHGGPGRRAFWGPVLVFGGTALLVLLPYLWEAYRIVQVEQPLEHTKYTKRWGDARNLWWLFQRSFLFSSIWGSRIYLENVQKQFYAFVGQPLAFLFHNDLFGWFGKIAAIGFVFAYPVQLLRRRAGFDSLRTFAFLAICFFLLVLHYLNIPTAPHYFQALWWIVFVGIAFTVTRLQGFAKRAFLATLLATALVNTAYDLTCMAYAHMNKGARNLGFSVVIDEQMRVIREICVEADHRIPKEARVDLADVFISGWSFVYLPNHMPECRGVKFTADHNLTQPNFRLSHPKDSDSKADLIVNWL